MVTRSITNLGRNGLSDWFLQRVSAVVMLAYAVVMLVFFVLHPHADYSAWQALFSNLCFKILTLLMIINLLAHSWIGIWTVLTDYVKPFALRLFLQVALVLFLFGCFFAVLFTLWRV